MNNAEQAVELAASICRPFEGLFLRPYLCPARVPTIGYGSTRYEDGTRVALTDPAISAQRAEALLMLTLRRDYLPGVLKASPGLLRFPRKLAAILDFAYNCGTARYLASTLRKRVEAEDWEGAATEIQKWNKGGGKVLAGLVKRRKVCAALLLES